MAAGNGNFAIAAARRGGQVTATDFAPHMVDLGRERSSLEGLAITWLEADAESLPLPAAEFDVAASVFGAMFAPGRRLVGSEGTLGVITQLTLKLSGIPEAISGGICPFPSVEACCNTAIHTIQSGIPVARIELLDSLQVRACNLHSNLGLPETPMLFLEFHGTEASVAEQSKRFGEIAAEFGGGPFTWTTRPEERTRLWEARHHAALSNFALRPGATMVATDVCVPISRLAECVTETQRDIEASRILAPIVGHVGDGNFHLTLLVDMDDRDELKARRSTVGTPG